MLLLVTVYITSVSSVQAVSGGWITKYRIEDVGTGQLILEKDLQTGATSGSGSIFEGAELKVTVTINIGVNNPSANLKLGTSMLHSALQANKYWELQSQDYSLGTFNPNQQTISFSQTAGVLVISCYGKVPVGKVSQVVGGVTLHKPIPISLVSLQDPGAAILDEVKPNITDARIDEYQNLLKQKEAKLQSLKDSGVAAGFIEIYANVINQTQSMVAQGFTDSAISLLNGLSVSSEPASATMEVLFLPIIGVLAAVSVAAIFLFLKARGKIGYFQLVVEDQIKDLEGLTLRASKVDRTISSNLESVKDRLKRLVGM